MTTGAISILKEYISENLWILSEGRVEDAREKYPDMDDESFDYIVANQPAGSNNKYLLWSLKQADALLENDPDPQGLRIVIQAVRHFDGNKQRLEKKDINQYANTEEIEAAVEKLGMSKGQQAKQVKADTDTIYNDERFYVVRPYTTEASCKYGIDTKWCIAATASRNYFNSYSSSNNKFYFVIDKQAQPKEASSKFAIVILDPIGEDTSRIQCFDATDRQVGLQAVIRHCGAKWPAIWSKIKEHAHANPITREVEEARKSSEEHVKNLLKGEKVSLEGLKKIARDVELTTPIIVSLIKRLQELTGTGDYMNPRMDIISLLAGRAAQLPGEGALALIKYISTTKPNNGDRYWGGHYHIDSLIKNSPLAPDGFRELARTSDELTLSTLINNPNCPADVVDMVSQRLPELKDKEIKQNVWRGLIKHGTITTQQMRDAMAGTGLAYEVLNYPQMSARLTPELLRLVPINSGSELKRFLALPNIPPDLSADLINSHWKRLKKPELYELLRTINLPMEMIERIWNGQNTHIRTALLQNPAIGVENAKKFVRSRNSAYRFAVAHNTILPAEELDVLASDESASTRAAVAANQNTSAKTVRVLASDEATIVRAGVASNDKAPRDILDALKSDSDDFVRKTARKTLKTLSAAEAYVNMVYGMGGLLTEELVDDDTPDTMSPHWSEIPSSAVATNQFVAIFLLQNNGHATREEVEAAYQRWNPQHDRTKYRRSGYRRVATVVKAKNVWQILKDDEQFQDHHARTTHAGGSGWWWSPPGINKGAVLRLTPTGAAAALEAMHDVRTKYPRHWTTRRQPDVKKSPPPRELAPRQATGDSAAAGTAAARGPKTTYKIYGGMKGAPVHTRLKGKAYVGSTGTRFSPGEQAIISPEEDKLRVKKVDSDHSQLWEPTDG